MKKISKTEAKKQIHEFFFNSKDKTPKKIKKIKKLAMNQSIPLGELKKTFCKKCFCVYKNPKIRIKNKIKIIICGNCGYVGRWKLKFNSS